MLQNSGVTDFTVIELLRENQLGGGVKFPPPTQIRVKELKEFIDALIKSLKMSKSTIKYKINSLGTGVLSLSCFFKKA